MNLNDLFTEEKVRLDPKCWKGKKIGNPKTKVKGGVRVNNCVPAESVAEMDSQQPTGRIKPDGTRSHSTYGSRDHYSLGDPETTLGPDSVLTAKDVAKKAGQTLDKAFSKSHEKGVAEGLTKQARARKEAESVKAAIERLEQQLNDPNPHIDKDSIRRRLETEKRRLELYRDVLDEQGVAEGYDEDEGNPVMNAITSRIMRTRPDLLQYDLTQLQAAIRDVALDVGDVDEIGSSDISGWVRRVEQQLSGKHMTEGSLNEGDKLFYAKNPDGTKTYARVKDSAQLGQLQQKYAGSQVKLMSFDRPDVAQWLGSRGVDLRGFLPGMVVTKGAEVNEQDNEKIAGRYDPDEFDDMVNRLKHLAGAGPLKTVYDPQKRVYRNVPVAHQPEKK